MSRWGYWVLTAALLWASCQDVPSENLGAARPQANGPSDNVDTPWPKAEPLPAEFDFPPFVTMPALNQIVIGFRTVERQTARIHFGLTRDYGSTVVAKTSDGFFFSASLGLLEPASSYFYEVEIDGTTARRQGTFLTSGRSWWRFVHLGETHMESESSNVELFADDIRRFRPHLIIESGDMLDRGDLLDSWRTYFRTSQSWISNAIILPIGSNHVRGVGGNGFLQFFFSLPNNERWYETRYSNVRIFSLDSTYDLDQPEISAIEPDWLAAQLRAEDDANDEPALFTIGAWHYPACSTLQKGRSVSRRWVMDNFIDTFIDSTKNHTIDLVLVGHDKYYQRSLIDGTIPHLMSNAGKLAPAVEGNNHPRCTPKVTHPRTRSIILGTVGSTAIGLQAIDPQGVLLDSLFISPSSP